MRIPQVTDTTKPALEVGQYETFAVVDYPFSGPACIGLYSEHYRPGYLTLAPFTSETLNLEEIPRYTALLVKYDLRADDVGTLEPFVLQVTNSIGDVHKRKP